MIVYKIDLSNEEQNENRNKKSKQTKSEMKSTTDCINIHTRKKLTSNVDDQIQQKLKKFFEFSKQKFFTENFFQIERFEC